MEEKDLSQSKFLFERNVKNNRCCYVLLSQCQSLHWGWTSSAEAYRCCVRLSSCLPLPEAGRDRQACPRYLGIEGFIMFSIFFEKYAKYILKVNNIAKTSTQTNTQKRSTQKTDDSIANYRKKQKITESEVEIEVKNEVKSEMKRNYVLGTQDNTKDILVIPLHTNKVKSSSPCKQNPSKYSLF